MASPFLYKKNSFLLHMSEKSSTFALAKVRCNDDPI